MDANVRPATTSDVADVRRVARESWHATYDDLLGPEAVESVVDDWYDLYSLRRSVERGDGAFLVAEREEDGGTDESDAGDAATGEGDTGTDARDPEIVGFGQGVLGGGDAEDGAAQLPRLYVHPDCWGEGVGTALAERIESWAAERGAERLRLVVLADNEVGNAFYESRGFRTVGSRESEFDGETVTDYVREKEL
ncbi:GNAT family N-acetyltransferase [Halorussus gelatinilyticus]|uniref:GNAT family N-acetyltransferase n=1 Tax=Halorussus gelatinilyticus TaxID=2937524 RepID=A0A8U0INN5_9EURY|nr:GNAT family N-acetyltransferase [Halorussus gelatinilyticus]UPW02211.1 GNAT family N-acetyltransferase [Halorussus gelatinilyticus]